MANVSMFKKEDIKDEELKGIFDTLASIGASTDLAAVGAHLPHVFKVFFKLFGAVAFSEESIIPELRAKVALKVSTLNSCALCISVAHFNLKKCGITDYELKQVEANLTEKEALALDYAEAVTKDATAGADALLKLKDHFTDQEIVEIAFVASFFNMSNRFENSLGVSHGFAV